MKILLGAALAALLALAAPATPARLSAEQATRDLRVLERALFELHPGLERYQSADALAARFEAARRDLADGAEPGELYLWATRLSASVRCGHTWTNPLNQGPAMQALLDGLPALPVRVRLLQGRLLVTESADPAIARHDEILAIDGRPIADIVAALLPAIRADGSSDGKRLAQFNTDEQGGVLDRLLPLAFPPTDGRYRLRLRSPDGREHEARIAGQPVPVREAALARAGVAAEDLSWRLRIDGRTAVMTLPTFAFWRGEFDWQGFLQSSFEQLEAEGVTRLVIDLRQNEGGDSAIGRALVGHLVTAAYTPPAGRVESAYERVPYVLARFLDTWDFDFFDRTGQVLRGPGRNFLLREQPAPTPILPLSPRFAGEVVALTGPRMSSAGFRVARDLQATGTAVLVGEPTGGNRRGLNGGQLAWVTLPNSGVAVDIPLIATFYDDQPDAPVLPDLPVATTVEDVIAGRDPVMARALDPSVGRAMLRPHD